MLWLYYLTRLCGYELRLWKYVNNGYGIDDTLANSITIFRAKLSVYAALPLYVMSALLDEPMLLAAATVIVFTSGLLDGVDGFIAKFGFGGGESPSGRLLDPAADFMNAMTAFVIVLSEHNFEAALTVPAVGVTALGIFIYTLRVMTGVRTHCIARWAIVTMYAGWVFLSIEVASVHGIFFDGPWWLVGAIVGHTLFSVGLILMIVSTCIYARRAWPKIQVKLMLGTLTIT